MSGARKVHIKSFGCQMNVYDSHRMADTLAGEGYAETATQDDADLIILNTCHIREKAAEKVYSELGRVRELKQAAARDGRSIVVAVAGCVAQAEGAEIIRRAPAVDLVVGPQNYQHLPQLLAPRRRRRRWWIPSFRSRTSSTACRPRPRRPSGRAASRPSSPSRRAATSSAPSASCPIRAAPSCRGRSMKIVAEVERLAQAGVREVTLIGQNVNAYHGSGPDGAPARLGRLLERVARVPGIARLRYTTSHPGDMEDSLIAAHRDLASLMPHLHLPVQSGCDRILAAMNRRHTRAHYLDVIARLRRARPDMVFSTDFIVGFPTETEADFQESLALIEEVGFAGAYFFKYSPRPGTPAADMAEQVPEDVKHERLQRLQRAVERQQRAFNADCLGRTLPVLFERTGRYAGQIVGRSPYQQTVQVPLGPGTAVAIGDTAEVTITQLSANSLFGRLASEPLPLPGTPPQAGAGRVGAPMLAQSGD